MSPLTKVKMSPGKGQESGQTTQYERQRDHTVTGHGAFGGKAHHAEDGGRAARDKHAASEAIVAEVSGTGSRRAHPQKPGKTEPQSSCS